jgi:hypothetical protein
MPRDQLEEFAIRALLRLRSERQEALTGNLFVAVLIGFLLGTIVAASGFFLGLGLV